MAAPSGAFATFKLPTLLPGVALYNNNLALKLGDYGNNIKTLFYLDHLLLVQNGGNIGFMGMVAANSLNSRMHNMSTRQSKIHSRGPNGQEYLLLNDAGLNTYGYGAVNYPVTRFANRFKADYTINAAYYADTTDFGYDVSVNNGAFNRYSLGGYVAARTNASGRYTMFSNAHYNDLVRFRPYVTNSEGTFIGDEQYFYALDQIESVGGRQRLGSPCDYNNVQNIEMWFLTGQYQALQNISTTPSNTQLYGYTNDNMDTTLGAGYWVFDDPTKVFVSDSNGMFTSYIYCAPQQAAKDIEVYVNMWDDTHYGIQINVNGTSQYYNNNISVNGYLGVFDQSGAQQYAGNSGDGSFNIFIGAGQAYGAQNMNFTANNLQAGWTVRPVITSTNPSNLTYNPHNG